MDKGLSKLRELVMDREDWHAAIHMVSKSWTWLSDWTELNWSSYLYGFLDGVSGQEPTCQCRRHKRCGFDPGLGRSPGGGHGNSLSYFCLENPMDRGAWWSTVHRITKSGTWQKRLSMHVCVGLCIYSYTFSFFPGSGRSPGEGNSNPLQYSCLENLMDGEAW